MATMKNIMAWSKDLNRGYPKSIVTSKIDEKYLCNYCKCLLRFPIQAGCGDRFCRACSDVLLGLADPQCPVCKEKLDRKLVFRDMFAERETLGLGVLCGNVEFGCAWTGQLKDWEDHMDRCEYRRLECPNGCGKFIHKSQFERHSTEDCTHRRVLCQYCQMSVAAMDVDQHMREECANRPSVCDYCKKVSLPRDKMEEHIRTQCPDYVIKCSYFEQGCSGEFMRRNEVAHMTEYTQLHLTLVSRALVKKSKQVDLLQDSLDVMKTQISQLTQTIPSTGVYSRHIGEERVFEASHQTHASYPGARGRASTSTSSYGSPPPMTSSMAGDGAHKGEVEKLKTEMGNVNESMKTVESSVAAVSRTQGLQDVQMADMSLRIDIIDVKTSNGVLVWKIGDITRRRREAQSGRTPSLYSAPFYTSPAGYKMCARVYLDGDGMGKGACVSLFFVLMRGEYDALLPWPFQLRVTMILMDQSEDGTLRRHITEVFKPDRRSASFRRPSSEMNTGSGCPMFAPVTVLESPTYVKDDTVFIKVIVDKTTSHFNAPDSERV